MSTRAEREAYARKRRDDGLLLREIAAEMGVAVSTVNAYLNDPGGARLRARKDSYRGVCSDCGGPTDGSKGPDGAPTRCDSCSRTHSRALTHAYILESFHEWHRLFGVPPSAADWNQHYCRMRLVDAPAYAERVIRRYENTGRDWPRYSTVADHFGSWTAALKAAGYEVLPAKDRWLGYRGVAAREETRLERAEERSEHYPAAVGGAA